MLLVASGCAAAPSPATGSSPGAGSPSAGDEQSGGPGTPLRDGLSVRPGSQLLGAVFEQDGLSEVGGPVVYAWSAVLLIDGDPIEVWRSYLTAFPPQRNPGLDPAGAPGCARSNRNLLLQPGCRVLVVGTSEATGGPQQYALTLSAPDGDVTGHYQLMIASSGDYISEPRARVPDPGDGPGLPDVVAQREPPQVGDVLGPGVAKEYALLPGTVFLAQYGPGSITGGFDVILQVSPEADLNAVVGAYAEQANQFPDSTTAEVVRYSRVEGDTTYTTVTPPGGAGGYQGFIRVVDQPGADHDYLYYSLVND